MTMKGQWFLISAVVASGVFLALSALFKSYFVVDPAFTARHNEDFYFNNVREQFNNVISASDCTSMDRNLREFRAFTQRELGNMGYFLFMNYTFDCNAKTSKLGLLVASPNMLICQNINVKDIFDPTVKIDLTCYS